MRALSLPNVFLEPRPLIFIVDMALLEDFGLRGGDCVPIAGRAFIQDGFIPLILFSWLPYIDGAEDPELEPEERQHRKDVGDVLRMLVRDSV